MKLPHIIYYHSHDTGRYFQPYGYAVPTPWVQRLAEEGLLFRKAFAAAPTCSPSRAALLTGAAAHSVGMLGLAHQGFALNDYRQTLLEVLNQAGYETVLCGGQHLIPASNMEELGYGLIRASERIPTAAHASQNAVGHLTESDFSRPLFLDVGAFETHRYQNSEEATGPYAPDGPQGDGRYVRPPEPIPDIPECRADWADFCASAARLDDGLGQIYQQLERCGQLENTLIICTTDHGPPLPGMKCELKDFGIQVGLILRGPGGFSGGKVVEDLVSQIDLAPTLCDLIGQSTPDWMQGNSLLPVVAGEKPGRSEVFSEINFHGAYKPQRCVRTERHKLIRRYPSDEAPWIRTCDASPVRDAFEQAGWSGHSRAKEELYDLLLDPNETTNLTDEAEMAAIKGTLRQRLDDWMSQTHDPLLAGRLTPPEN